MPRPTDIKRSQRERLLLREISDLFMKTALDDPRLQHIFVNRVKLSADKSICTVFFYAPDGQDYFEQKLNILILYKPSLRAALAKKIESRYTPDLIFKWDDQYEKEEKINTLIEQLKSEGEL